MLDKARKANRLRKLQSEMEKLMEQVYSSKEKRGVKVVANATGKVISIEVEGSEDKLLKDLVNDVIKDAKKKAEKRLRGQASALGDIL